MPIDASIPLRAGQNGFSLADIMRDAEALRVSEQQREIRQFQLDQMRSTAKRGGKSDGALADLMIADRNRRLPPANQGVDLASTSPAFDPNRPDVPAPTDSDPNRSAPTSLSQLAITRPHMPEQAPTPFERLARVDPDRAQAYEKNETAITRDQFKMASELNEGALQILGGVNDQASYDAAKQQAAAMYSRYGFDINELQLPPEYSPGTINRLRYQAMSTQKQLEQIRADRKLDWQVEDAQIDNDRADRNTDSLITDRSGRRAETQRYHNQRDATTRQGQASRERTTTRGQDVRAATAGKRGTGYTATAVGPGGVRIHYDATTKAWVDEQGKPVQ